MKIDNYEVEMLGGNDLMVIDLDQPSKSYALKYTKTNGIVYLLYPIKLEKIADDIRRYVEFKTRHINTDVELK